MSRQSFLEPAASDASEGDTLALTGAEAHHARVKRVQPGEEVDVVSGTGVRLRCEVTDVGQDEVSLTVLERSESTDTGVRTVLVQALAKGDRDLQAVESCVEIGVDGVIPWQADRSIVRWKAEREEKAHAKWRAQVQAATKQSRRAALPEVEPKLDTAGLARRVEAVTAAGGRALVLHEEATRGLGALLREDPLTIPAAQAGDVVDQGAPAASGSEVLLIVGPEGGISEQEIRRLREAGAVPVGLGPHILRASTAGAVALTLVRASLGAYD